MSGQQALRRLRADPALAGLPVSIFTGLHNPRLEADCRSLGVDPFVFKPMDLDEYGAAVSKVLNIRSNL